MSALSEVSVLIGQRARDIEKAREIFTAEIRAFVGGILAGVRRIRSDPWTTSRVRVDLPREIENEAKASSDFSSQYAVARTELRFKKGTKFVQIADIRMGIEFDEGADVFAWQITLVPAARYNRVDDVVWHQWRTQHPTYAGARHQDKANTVRFVSRALGPDVTAETAFNDVKTVLEFLLTIEAQLAEAVGLDIATDDE
ncbi:MAG: hypothetical protein AB7T06_22300 [Kofleriaceae bacterium]